MSSLKVDEIERLLLEADASLKRAKSLGRNRVERSGIAASSLSAHYLQCSPAVVQRLIAEGTLKTTEAGLDLRIPKLAIEDYRSAKVLDIKPKPAPHTN